MYLRIKFFALLPHVFKKSPTVVSKEFSENVFSDMKSKRFPQQNISKFFIFNKTPQKKENIFGKYGDQFEGLRNIGLHTG